MAELSLIVKNSQTQEGRNTPRQCSHCQKSRQGAGRCESNPHRNTRCPRCQKWGHSEATCWIKIKSEQTRKVTIAEVRTESGVEQKLASSGHPFGYSAGNQVSIVTEVCSDDFVAATKSTVDGEPLPKQVRAEGDIPVQDLFNSAPRLRVPRNETGQLRQLPRGRRLRRRKNKTKRACIQEHVGKYNVVAELANAPAGLTFGVLMRGDADEAKKESRCLLASSNTRKSVAASASVTPRRLKVVAVRVFGTDVQAVLDTGAVPNLLSTSLAYDLGLTLKPTTKKITIANGKRSICRGLIENVPVSFAGIRVSMDFLVVNGMPFDVIIGAPALESLHAQLDLGQQTVKVSVGGLSAEFN